MELIMLWCNLYMNQNMVVEENIKLILKVLYQNLERRYRETNSEDSRDKIEEYMAETPCPKCKGAKLKKEVLSVLVDGKNIMEVTDFSVNQLENI